MIRHIITSEYPPQPGGVSDYTHTVAEGLAAAGDEVHVWSPKVKCGDLASPSQRALQLDCSPDAEPQSDVRPPHSTVSVHRVMGAFTPRDLLRASRHLDRFPAPRRVLVQWVPHGYAFRSMNLAFCLWLWRRSWRGDEIELMVHEPSLGFGEGNVTHNIVAVVHRLMTIVLLLATRRVWISIPAWEQRWRPYTLGRQVEFRWLPVGSNIPVVEAQGESKTIRARFRGDSKMLIGHFGAYDAHTTAMLLKSVAELAKENVALLLLGHGSERMRNVLIERDPALANRLHATGSLDAAALSRHIRACDLMLQPYVDGVSSRRTSTMTALAHGIPVVTTLGKFTEPVWQAGNAVVLAPAHDVAELVRRTTQLLPDDSGRERLAAAARKFYEEHFATSKTIAALRAPMEMS